MLRLGTEAAIELTGLRHPCVQVNEFQDGLMALLRYRDSDGSIVRIVCVMAIVLRDGIVVPGADISVELPTEPHHPLEYILDSHNPG